MGGLEAGSRTRNQAFEYCISRAVTVQLRSNVGDPQALGGNSPRADTSGSPLLSPCALEESPGVTAKFQMFRFKRDDSSSEWTSKSIQKAQGQRGANLKIGCWSSAFIHRWHDSDTKRKLSLLRALLAQKNPMWDSYLVRNQEWNARDEPKALKARTKRCMCCLWLSLPLTAMACLLCLVRNYVKPFIFILISKHLRQCEKRKIINPDVISGSIIWWVPSYIKENRIQPIKRY